MKFKYSARNQDGELQVGFVESYSKDGAVNILTNNQLFILSIESAENISFFDRFFSFFRRIGLGDLMVFTRQFAILMESKVPIVDSLRNLTAQTHNKILQEIIREISTDVESGLSLSQAFQKQEKVFSEFYISMVRSAEITGHLEEAMIYLADYLEKEKIWRSRMANAMIYPAFLITGFFAVVLLMVMFVFPKIKPIFEESGVALPWFTKIILSSGDFLVNWWWAIGVIIVPIILFIAEYLKTTEGKVVLNEFFLRQPVFGELLKKSYISRFAQSTGILVKGGIPIAQAIEISGHSIGSYVMRDILHSVAEEVRGGKLLSESLKGIPFYFPPLVSQMVAVGETTGRLEEILEKVAVFYSRDVEDLINRLSELVQPVLIIFIGFFIGVLFASILIPIYNLIQNFQ